VEVEEEEEEVEVEEVEGVAEGEEVEEEEVEVEGGGGTVARGIPRVHVRNSGVPDGRHPVQGQVHPSLPGRPFAGQGPASSTFVAILMGASGLCPCQALGKETQHGGDSAEACTVSRHCGVDVGWPVLTRWLKQPPAAESVVDDPWQWLWIIYPTASWPDFVSFINTKMPSMVTYLVLSQGVQVHSSINLSFEILIYS